MSVEPTLRSDLSGLGGTDQNGRGGLCLLEGLLVFLIYQTSRLRTLFDWEFQGKASYSTEDSQGRIFYAHARELSAYPID